jgi:hypothetical protein
MAQVGVGHRVQVRIRGQRAAQRGIVRFVGETAFKEGPWVGVQLDSAVGKNDGSVDGTRYFRCRAGYGIFVRPAYVTVALEQSAGRRDSEPPTPRAADPYGVADALRDLVREIDVAGLETDATGATDASIMARLGSRRVQESVAAGAARRAEDAADEWRLRLDGLAPPTKMMNGGTNAMHGVSNGDDIHGADDIGLNGGGTCTCRMASWLVQLLSHGQVRLAALRTIGNVVATEPADQTQAVLDCGLLPALRELLDAAPGPRWTVGSDGVTKLDASPRVQSGTFDEFIMREAAFVASNLLAGTPQQVESTLRAGIAPLLFAHLDPLPLIGGSSIRGYAKHSDTTDWAPVTQYWPRTNWAAVAIANVLLRGQRAQVALVVAQGCDTRCE